MEFVSSGEGHELAVALVKIKDASVRKRVLDLVKALAAEEEQKYVQTFGGLVACYYGNTAGTRVVQMHRKRARKRDAHLRAVGGTPPNRDTVGRRARTYATRA